MKRKTLLFNSVLMSLALGTITSCYDLDEMSRNPYELMDGGTATGTTTEETDTILEKDTTNVYADINLNFTVSKEDSANYKVNLADAGPTFRNFLYEGYYNDYQITTNLTHDIYAGYVANNQPKHAGKSSDYQYGDGWSGVRWAHFYNDRSSEYRNLLRSFKFNGNAEKYKNAFYITRIYYAFLALA
ncbi:MAG: SusD/RagB family nutrient-binding outer membrane lipoprotein, partial [Prevotella sp.]|nr:SusD/RagB family nutrient-binding outer membrane lipoprotein [Prevotella sp.]